MSGNKEKIKNLMISLLNQDGVISTAMSDSGDKLTIRFDENIISMEDLYDLARELRELNISITYMNYTR
ncbi:MAG: hypothetical protein V2I37_03920 [Marinilabiliaceae bacterium]|jgi:hypothetical protein|nr:hypothetical protein [Marinilabiliaceae bacterium]